MYIYKLISIDDYLIPTEAKYVTDIIGKGICFENTQSKALREFYKKIMTCPLYMRSQEKLKAKLIDRFKGLYIEEYPEVFI